MKLWRIVGLLALCVLSVTPVAWTDTLEDGLLRVQVRAEDRALGERALRAMREMQGAFSDRLPAGDAPIVLAVCHSKDMFDRYAGPYTQPNVGGVAHSEAGLMAVKTPSLVNGPFDFDATVRHEMLHVLLARSIPLENLPRWLNEGICMHFSGEFRWGSRYRVAQMYAQGGIGTYQDLAFVFTSPGNELEFGDAYAQALSMTRYLYYTLGDDVFWALVADLRTTRFREALTKHAGVPPEWFYSEWLDSLAYVAAGSLLVSGYVFMQAMAFLVILAYIRKRQQGQAIMAAWEQEERDDDSHTDVFAWELEDTEPEPWLEDEEDEW